MGNNYKNMSNNIDSTARGSIILQDPLRNKGTAFTPSERQALGLEGLLPDVVETLEQQTARCYAMISSLPDNYAKYLSLRALQDTNEVLYYSVLNQHVEEMLPIVYTPTVADGCRFYSDSYRRPRGLVISLQHRGKMREVLRNRAQQQVDVIVVTDGERILGIGDQGVGGMGIPIGKLALYTLVGGVDPAKTLPITLDVGTNNEELLSNPNYLGLKQPRVTGAEYDAFIDEFVEAVKAEMPTTLLQWEDFAKPNARPILDRYKDKLLTFNDDIQGTAAVALGAVMAAIKVTGKALSEQQIVFLGAGAASIGVADYLKAAMLKEGLSEEQARQRFWIVNSGGVLHDQRSDLSEEQLPYCQSFERIKDFPKTAKGKTGLMDVISEIEATILIGLSTVGGAFFEGIVREMASKVERPIIFPLSNPTVKAEAQPEDLIRWTDGRVLVAAGSPFAPVEFAGSHRVIAQCNNVFIFPAVGLGLVASGAQRVSDEMMIAAACELANHSPALQDVDASLLPRIADLPVVADKVALAVAMQAVKEGLCPAMSEAEMQQRIAAVRWKPEYSLQ